VRRNSASSLEGAGTLTSYFPGRLGLPVCALRLSGAPASVAVPAPLAPLAVGAGAAGGRAPTAEGSRGAS
jgi:hypothetical protein